jgi:hypothetical protein
MEAHPEPFLGARLTEELCGRGVPELEDVRGDQVCLEFESLMLLPPARGVRKLGVAGVSKRELLRRSRPASRPALAEMCTESRCECTFADVHEAVTAGCPDAVDANALREGYSASADHSLQSCPHQLKPCGSPPRPSRGERPGRWLASGSLAIPPRNLLPAATSFALLPDDMRKPAGIRPKFTVGERPASCRYNPIATASRPLRQVASPAIGRPDTSNAHRVECSSAHNAGPAVCGSRYGITSRVIPSSIRTRALIPTPV